MEPVLWSIASALISGVTLTVTGALIWRRRMEALHTGLAAFLLLWGVQIILANVGAWRVVVGDIDTGRAFLLAQTLPLTLTPLALAHSWRGRRLGRGWGLAFLAPTALVLGALFLAPDLIHGGFATEGERTISRWGLLFALAIALHMGALLATCARFSGRADRASSRVALALTLYVAVWGTQQGATRLAGNNTVWSGPVVLVTTVAALACLIVAWRVAWRQPSPLSAGLIGLAAASGLIEAGARVAGETLLLDTLGLWRIGTAIIIADSLLRGLASKPPRGARIRLSTASSS